MYHIVLTTIFLCIGNTIIAMEYNDITEEETNKLYTKAYDLISPYYTKNHLPFALHQTKIPSTEQPKDTALWDNRFKQPYQEWPKESLKNEEEKRFDLNWADLIFSFVIFKNKNMIPEYINKENPSLKIKSCLFINSHRFIKAVSRCSLGYLVFPNAKHMHLAIDRKKLITLDTKKSTTQTEYDLTPFLNDVNAIYTMPEYEIYKLVACDKEVKDTVKKDALVKKIMDEFLRKNEVRQDTQDQPAKKQKTT